MPPTPVCSAIPGCAVQRLLALGMGWRADIPGVRFATPGFAVQRHWRWDGDADCTPGAARPRVELCNAIGVGTVMPAAYPGCAPATPGCAVQRHGRWEWDGGPIYPVRSATPGFAVQRHGRWEWDGGPIYPVRFATPGCAVQRHWRWDVLMPAAYPGCAPRPRALLCNAMGVGNGMAGYIPGVSAPRPRALLQRHGRWEWDGRPIDPGCASRPRALLCNAMGVGNGMAGRYTRCASRPRVVLCNAFGVGTLMPAAHYCSYKMPRCVIAPEAARMPLGCPAVRPRGGACRWAEFGSIAGSGWPAN